MRRERRYAMLLRLPRTVTLPITPPIPLLIALLIVASMLASCSTTGELRRSPQEPPRAADLVHSLDQVSPQEYDWGWIRWLMNAETDPQATLTFGVVELEAGQTNPVHRHNECDELLYMVSGSCEHRIGEEWITLRAGDLVRIPAGVPHTARTLAEPMRAVVVYDTGTRDFIVVEERVEERG
jgi:quercetin dioxygenase-like cupin family protein